jgi:cytochrome c-type biogenesis protein CcmH
MKRAICAFLIATGMAFAAPVPSAEAGQKDIEAQLACQCGCGLTVLTCNHLQCGFAVPVRKRIAEELAAGDSDEEIIQRLVDEYGEKVLSSPTHTGFNLLAWYIPYAAVFVGGVLVFFVMRKWQRPAVELSAESPAPDVQKSTAEQREALERELKELDS